jgi:hypothetical protein
MRVSDLMKEAASLSPSKHVSGHFEAIVNALKQLQPLMKDQKVPAEKKVELLEDSLQKILDTAISGLKTAKEVRDLL